MAALQLPAFCRTSRGTHAVGVALAAVVLLPSLATAQYCPSEPRTIVLTGTITTAHSGNWDNAPSVSAQTYPCEEYYADYSVTYDGPPLTFPNMPNFFVGFTDAANHTFETDIVQFPSSWNGQLPTGDDYGFPVPGTLHPNGNIAAIKVWSNRSFLPLTWTVTIRTTPRPGYNTGGLSFEDAPLVHDNDTLHLSLTSIGSKNYYKVVLKPGGTLNLSGTVTNDWTLLSGQVIARVYNSAQQYVRLLTDTRPAPLTTVSLANPQTYTNTSAQTGTFYITFKIGLYADLSDSSIQVHAQEATLKLFLDTANNFSATSPTDDGATFVPGSSGGASLPLPTATTPIQRAQLIAAFVDAAGNILSPPTAGTATFALSNTSSFAGIAMNAPEPRPSATEDYVLETTSSTFSTDKTARVWLQVWDYGGFTSASATVEGITSAVQRYPHDTNANLLPDAGWNAAATHVADTGMTATDDTDSDLVVTAPPATGLLGDGLSAFEEYRGFVVDGSHTRTDPQKKDLFTTFITAWQIGYASNLPLQIHVIRGEDETPGAEEYVTGRIINSYRGNSSGDAIAGFDQRAIRLRDTGTYRYATFGLQCGTETDPAASCESWWLDPPGHTPARFHTPDTSREVLIYVASHQDLVDAQKCQWVNIGEGGGMCPYTQLQADNEIRRTIGHEMGHAVGLCHRGQCLPEVDDTGLPASLMSTGFYQGPSGTAPTANYDTFDRAQIRLHER